MCSASPSKPAIRSAFDCSVRDDLEIHHVDPVGANGKTSLKNCSRLCKWHHYLCTHQCWRVEGSAQEGWRLVPPDDRAPPATNDPDPPDLRLAV